MLQAVKYGRKEIIVKTFIILIILWAANLAYCLIHETAHAVIAVAAGGEVYGVYVNALGDKGHTIYSPLDNPMTMAAVYAAGTATTTLLALGTLWLDITPVTMLFAIRTSLSALNYSPGTDMAMVQALAGETSIYLSIVLIIINTAVVMWCLKKPYSKLINAFSSLWRARPEHNSPE